MAVITYATYLMYKAAGESAYSVINPVKDYPDLFADPEELDTTTLSDDGFTSIPGINDNSKLSFTMNYTKDAFDKLKALEGTDANWALYFGDESGTDGKYGWSGKPHVSITGKGVNEVREMTLSIYLSTGVAVIS